MTAIILSAGHGSMLLTGFEVRTFGSAMEFVQRKRPDLSACLILDVRLPALSGLDLMKGARHVEGPSEPRCTISTQEE